MQQGKFQWKFNYTDKWRNKNNTTFATTLGQKGFETSVYITELLMLILFFCYYTIWMWVMLLTFRRCMLGKVVSFCIFLKTRRGGGRYWCLIWTVHEKVVQPWSVPEKCTISWFSWGVTHPVAHQTYCCLTCAERVIMIMMIMVMVVVMMMTTTTTNISVFSRSSHVVFK
jgi:hypothetical protein